ncbi:MAG: alpha/beta hydrolase [Gammaproteobacteria bacterium]|nr:MAG: alpha/beta hydrolase [Gammaproteobacteria bacterium]RLA09371.1 MAG: alpha/beta hydrolase [Gammaproteobacteria bacterium]
MISGLRLSLDECRPGREGQPALMNTPPPERKSGITIPVVLARVFPTVTIRAMVATLFAISLTGCSGLFFFPAKELSRTPTELGLEYEGIELTAADGTGLHAWWLPAVEQSRGTILFLHGNAENISTHIHNVRWLPARGYQVLLLDYRGYGRSAGKPRLPDIFLDIDAAVSWLAEAPETAGQPLFILGQSIGASLMLYAATGYLDQPGLCGLISDAAFTGYGDIGQHVAAQSWLTWPIQYPFGWALIDGYDPIAAVAQLELLPILFFHSRDDEIIPFASLDELVGQHPGASQRVETNGPHTATFNMQVNRQILLEFLANNRCTDDNNAAAHK